jgi:hypothetical protein
MAKLTTMAATTRQTGMGRPTPTAQAVPTMTGTTEAGSVRGRAPNTQRLVVWGAFTEPSLAREQDRREFGWAQ